MARKYFPHNSVLFCTSRTEEGLPIVCTHNMNFIIWGIMAKATEVYNIDLCHFIFMGNHFHFILRVINPEDVQGFIRYVKSETAHAINRLLGRKQKTIWKGRYDSPLVLDEDKLKDLITYLYLNPVRANLVNSIDEYPGVSSWNMFKSSIKHKFCKKIARNKIKRLYSPTLTPNKQKETVQYYETESKEFKLTLSPLNCFKALNSDRESLQKEIVDHIYSEEKKIRKDRKYEPIGITGLRRESMLKAHTPSKHSPKMICLSIHKELRRSLIIHYKYLCDTASKVYEAWKQGNITLKIPPGLFSPRSPTLVSLLSPF
jgi:REP element-mobilizing transposase RayT